MYQMSSKRHVGADRRGGVGGGAVGDCTGEYPSGQWLLLLLLVTGEAEAHTLTV